MNKDTLRLRMQAKRRELFGGERSLAQEAVCDRLFASGLLEGRPSVNVYRSMGAELGTESLIRRLIAEGFSVSVPVTEGTEMSAVTVDETTRYRRGGFGIEEPVSGARADKQSIGLVLVPGLAFSERGDRIGYGKGCYDRFLQGMNAMRIGLCYDFQLVRELPREDFDIPMDVIVTDKRIVRCEK